MDWLMKVWIGFKKKTQYSSLRNALVIYMAAAIGCVILLLAVTNSFCGGWKKIIESHYEIRDMAMYLTVVKEVRLIDEMTPKDAFLMKFISNIENFSVFFYSIVAMIVVASLFYKNKIKGPMDILIKQAAHISRGELEYPCEYNSGDEMGILCNTFDSMRLKLVDQYEKTWELMEDQRRLNAAFAHDLRTPLTVLRGYTDFMSRYYPEGKISEDQLMDNLKLMNAQVLRLMDFSDTMKEVTSMEELEPKKKKITNMELEKKTQGLADIMDGMNGISISFSGLLKQNRVWILDDAVLMEVLENLVSNALRYASSKIDIQVEESEDGNYLELYVKDDGPGFTKDGLKKAAKPYYKDPHGKKGNHFGIGLFICKILCEKHGGTLSISNSIDGGSIVAAYFFAV